jgi:hypothetical protein
MPSSGERIGSGKQVIDVDSVEDWNRGHLAQHLAAQLSKRFLDGNMALCLLIQYMA